MVFKFSPRGHYTMLYAFKCGSDGTNPVASLLMETSTAQPLAAAIQAAIAASSSKLRLQNCSPAQS